MTTLVLGGAVSGLAAARLARRLGNSVMVYDRDSSVAGRLREERMAVSTGSWTRRLLAGTDLVVASPGFPERSEPIVDSLSAGLTVWSELEFGARHLDVPTVAVTGTNGKTTVTGLIAAMVEAGGVSTVAAGNIGKAITEVALEGPDRYRVVVVEASSFQLRFIDTFHPRTAVLLNVAPDHLDWHGSFEAYLEAKRGVFRNQEPGDSLIFDVDDEGAQRAVSVAPSRLVPVSGSRRPPGGAGVSGGSLDLGDLVVPLRDIPVSDPAFLVDLAAAGVAALEEGVPAAAVEAVIVGFRPGAHRRTVVGEWGGVAWIDDSKATNPHAALASIRAFPSVVLIAGGRNKGLDLTEMATAANVRRLIAIGEAAPELLAACDDGRAMGVASLDEAVVLADQTADPGDTVLLAPGCASFDMFRSYADRGDSFARAVHRLKERT